MEKVTNTHFKEFISGYSIEVIHPFDYPTFSAPGYKEVKFPLVRSKIIRQKINNIQPDHIHIATEGILGWIARAYCIKNNLNFTTSYHTRFPEFLDSLYKIPQSLTYKIIKNFHSKSSMILINTPTMIQELSEKGFENLKLWTRGIDRNIFNPRPNSKLRDSIDPTRNKKIILYVGRVSKEKNIETFCDLSEKFDKYVNGEFIKYPFSLLFLFFVRIYNYIKSCKICVKQKAPNC